jgi:hypothetical protein
LRAVLAALWAGGLLTIATIAAPTLFQLLDRGTAGKVAGRYFFVEAKASLIFVAVLLLIERADVRGGARPKSRAQGRAQFTVNLGLLLGALLTVIVGYEVLHPMMEAARLGQAGWTFMQLHGASMVLYALRTLLVLVLAWRCSEQAGKV